MDILKKIKDIAIALIMILGGGLLLAFPEDGFQLVIIILSVTISIYGLGHVINYLTMTKHMVGGKSMLYIGMMMMEFGIFTASLYTVPKIYIIIYLAGTYLFSGLVDILRAMESKQNLSSWKLKFTLGIGNVVIAICCFVFSGYPDTVVIIYSAGLFYAAMARVIGTFRRTSTVYIQA